LTCPLRIGLQRREGALSRFADTGIARSGASYARDAVLSASEVTGDVAEHLAVGRGAGRSRQHLPEVASGTRAAGQTALVPNLIGVLKGLGFIVGGLLGMFLATRPQSRYPKAPGVLKGLGLPASAMTSDRGWAWRYRLSFGGLGLCCLVLGFCFLFVWRAPAGR
jgi:hypothetical protein